MRIIGDMRWAWMVMGCVLFSTSGCVFWEGTESKPSPVSEVFQDQEVEQLVDRAWAHAKAGRYLLAEGLYAQAFRRALQLDLPEQVTRLSLTLAAFSLDREDAEEAQKYLGALEGIQLPQQDLQIRSADLHFRLARLTKAETLADDRKRLADLLAACPTDIRGTAIPLDAELTLREDQLDRGLPVAVLPLPAGCSDSVLLRMRAQNSRIGKNAEGWIAVSRDYARGGNYPAAIREALRCAELLNDPQAARMALRMATAGEYPNYRERAEQLLKKMEGNSSNVK